MTSLHCAMTSLHCAMTYRVERPAQDQEGIQLRRTLLRRWEELLVKHSLHRFAVAQTGVRDGSSSQALVAQHPERPHVRLYRPLCAHKHLWRRPPQRDGDFFVHPQASAGPKLSGQPKVAHFANAVADKYVPGRQIPVEPVCDK